MQTEPNNMSDIVERASKQESQACSTVLSCESGDARQGACTTARRPCIARAEPRLYLEYRLPLEGTLFSSQARLVKLSTTDQPAALGSEPGRDRPPGVRPSPPALEQSAVTGMPRKVGVPARAHDAVDS